MTTTLVKDALSKSTFHGLPRLVNSPSIYMRLFWSILVCACVSTFGWHVSALASKYWNDNIVTSSDLRGMKFKFPYIYLCHKIPASLSYFQQKSARNDSDLATFRNLLRDSKKLQQDIEIQHKLKIGSDSHFFWATERLNGLIDTIGHRSFQTVSRLYIQEKEVNVSERVVFQFIREHLYCYQIAATSREMGYTSEEVRLVVYSDRNEDTEYEEFLSELGLDDEYSFGLRVYFTKPETVLNFETQLVHIRPGYFYDIRLKMLSYELYNSSTRFCYEDEVSFMNLVSYEIKDNYKLNDLYQSCVDSKTQELLVQQCGCYDIMLTRGLVTRDIYHRYPACFNVSEYLIPGKSSNTSVLAERSKCYVRYNENSREDKINAECKKYIPCHRNTYIPYWSFMKWPAENSIKTTVDTYIKEPSIERKKAKLPVPGWDYILNISSEVDQNIAVRSTFSEIKIRPQEFFSTVMKEIPQYPIINFWSDIGGILGLYLGVSILTFFEFIELVHNLIGTFLYARKEKFFEEHHYGKKTKNETETAPNCIHSSTSLWI